MAWFSSIAPQAGYRLFPTTGFGITWSAYTKTVLMADRAFLNIESWLASWRSSAYMRMEPGLPTDYPIPDLELTTRPKQSEIVQYADYTQRPQGPYSFQWGFRFMKPWVFGTWMYFLGFEKWNRTLYHFYDYDTPVWSVPVYVMTLDSGSERNIDYTGGSYYEVANYRMFTGQMLRPIPNKDYKPSIGGNYENVIFRFVGLTEILV